MQSLRRALFALAFAFVLAGCASASPPNSPPNAPRASPARTQDGAAFATDKAKLLACLDLRDHIVDLYATQYVTDQGLVLTSSEQTAFRTGWAEELAKKGTFDRFERSCVHGLTPRKYKCGMESTTPNGIVACMRLI